MVDPTPSNARPAADQPISKLLSTLAGETSALVRNEIQLAKAEASAKVSQATTGAALLAAAGVVLFAGLLFLLLSATLGLANWVAPWLAALIVGAVVVIVGLVMLYAGKNRLSTQNLKPRRTIESLREDADVVQDAAKGHPR